MAKGKVIKGLFLSMKIKEFFNVNTEEAERERGRISTFDSSGRYLLAGKANILAKR